MSRGQQKSRGITLVELMIAMLLGTIVTLIAIEMMVNSARVATLQDGLAEVNENGKFVLGFLRREFQLAGFSGAMHQEGIDPIDWRQTFDDGGPFDVITLRRKMFASDDYDCLGDAAYSGGADQIILSKYYVDRMPGQASVFELRCELMIEGATSAKSVKRTALIGGVESFQVQFGVVERGRELESWSPQYYLMANQIDPDRFRVVTVRFGLLLHNTQGYPLRHRLLAPEPIELLEQVYDEKSLDIDVGDGRLRRTFETTVELKNVVRDVSI